ncbi:ATP-dependent 6-phosphofructokinase [Aeromicrobium sp. CTD01-1L150]|uniref:ATP-dependent 6-phosphofructokinase n=1 Tax=Aeromicrobium sp. CTD01-1L150 TaxID=3341830 RepID=UPI0035BF971B
MVTRADLEVRTLGPCTLESPLAHYVGGRDTNEYYVAEDDRVLYDDTVELVRRRGLPLEELPTFETGGARRQIFFDPATTRAGIVTCGGLCPGLNDVIRAIVLELAEHYGVHDVLGFQHGYAGLIPGAAPEPIELTPDLVATINQRGGTILGTSRGAQDVSAIADRLVELGIDMLFVIGGDGSMRGAHHLTDELRRRELPIAVVGVPKTIDNDIPLIGQSFGFATAFGKAAESIESARVEVEATVGGIGLVQVMGRHAGFIACYAALANHDADFVLIPEVEFGLEGEDGLLALMEQRVRERGNVVVVLAEGAGQHLLTSSEATDASGNRALGDIGGYLRGRISAHFEQVGLQHTMRFFSPGYQIRSVAADASDSVFCARLAQTAVHAAMAGRTDVVVGRRRHRFVHVPIPLVTSRSHSVHPDGDLWLSVMESTAQPFRMG